MEKPDFLVLAAVHGDEDFSIPILEELTHQYPDAFDWVVGNEQALEQRVRHVGLDLNRVAPGSPLSSAYEDARAHELLLKAKEYRYVLDIHGTMAHTGIFAIVANPTPANIALAASLPVDRVVIWPSTGDKGPLTKYVRCGVGIECGPKGTSAMDVELREMLQSTFTRGLRPGAAPEQEWYRVNGKIGRHEWLPGKLRLHDFTQITIFGHTFYPLLVDEPAYPDVYCYKMEKIDIAQLLSK